MKKTLLTVLSAFGLMLSTTMIFGQGNLPKALVGAPDKYQDYFVFNKYGNLGVTNWVVEINEIVLLADSTTEPRLLERHRISDRSFLKLDKKYEFTPLYVEVKGFNNSANLIAYDVWEWEPPVPTDWTYWKALCAVRCVGPTYAYYISVMREEQLNQGPTNNPRHHVFGGHHGIWAGVYGSEPVAHWRNFNGEKKNEFCQNSSSTFINHPNNYHANINAPLHHGYLWCPENMGGTWDGVSFAFIPESSNNGTTYRDYQGNYIINTSDVWRVRKGWGKWGEFPNVESASYELNPEGLIPSADAVCGTMPQNGNIFGTALLSTWAPIFNPVLTKQTGTNAQGNPIYQTFPLECAQAPDGGSSNTGNPLNDGPFPKWYAALWISGGEFDKWVGDDPKPKPIGGNGIIFELLEAAQEEFAENNYLNTSGINWWPTDEVEMIQIYKVDHSEQESHPDPIVLSKSNLLDENGNYLGANFVLSEGLYNVVLFDFDNNSTNIIFELSETSIHSTSEADFIQVTIYPNPFDDNIGRITSKVESLVNTRYTYTIVDANNNEYYSTQGRISANDEIEILINVNNLPNGQLFHKFVFEDGSVIIQQTMKN